MTKMLLSVFLLAGLGCLATAIDIDQAKSKAGQYCSQLDIAYQLSRASARPIGREHDRRWMVMCDETFIILDNVDGRLLLIEDSAKSSKLRRSKSVPPKLAIESDTAGWNRARQVLRQLDLTTAFEERSMKRYSWGSDVNENNRGKAIGWFEVRPYGFGTFGNGNKAIVTLDTQTGNLISLELETRWAYLAPPATRIGAQAANNVAQPLVGVSRRTELGYFTPNGSFDSSVGRSLLLQRKVWLAYCVTSDQGSVIVDAAGGQVLGGGRFASKRSTQKQESNSSDQLGMSPSIHPKAAIEKQKLAAAFGYGHIPVAKIGSVKQGSRQVYLFSEANDTSEIVMCQSWPSEGWPEVAAFKPANDGPKLSKPITDKGSALRVLSKLVDAMDCKELRITTFNIGKGHRSGSKRHKDSILARVTGTFKTRGGKALAFSAVMIPSSGRFLYWDASAF